MYPKYARSLISFSKSVYSILHHNHSIHFLLSLSVWPISILTPSTLQKTSKERKRNHHLELLQFPSTVFPNIILATPILPSIFLLLMKEMHFVSI